MLILRFLFALLLITQLNAVTKLYLLPDEHQEALSALIKNINNAKKEIHVAIYSFTHRKISKALANAAAKGVKVTLYFDHDSNYKNRRSQIAYLAKLKNVQTYTLKGRKSKNGKYYGKMHMKLITIDQKILFLGSANWSYSAFGLSYETLFYSDEKKWIKKTDSYLQSFKKQSKKYF
jgi:phosphatidylserine/phosphatidylglycerophosphate/cardiolipin synthase-like enzyme